MFDNKMREKGSTFEDCLILKCDILTTQHIASKCMRENSGELSLVANGLSNIDTYIADETQQRNCRGLYTERNNC